MPRPSGGRRGERAETFATGALGAAVLAGGLAALFLAPAPAAAQTAFNCGTLTAGTYYGSAAYTGGIIRYNVSGAISMTLPGVATTGTTVSTGHLNYGSAILAQTRNGNNNRPINITIGGTGPVHLRQTGSRANA